MDTDTASPLFSRECLAGYDPGLMSRATVAIVGLGAGGCNLAQTLALSGVGNFRLVDFDNVEPSNLTRSPLFDRRRLGGKRARFKAREAALGVAANSYVEGLTVQFAIARIEQLGLGAFAGSDVVVSAVDSFRMRGWLADATRSLAIPLIELGFAGSRGQVSVFPNAAANEPCWRCLHPEVADGSASCTLYAQRVAATGAIPATQSLAAAVGAIAGEHVIQAIHGQFPLGGQAFFVDIRSGQTRALKLALDRCCPGVHRIIEKIRHVPVRSAEPVHALLQSARDFAAEPVLHLPAPFVVELPCGSCGSPVKLERPSWKIAEAPNCPKCPDLPQLGSRGTVVATTIALDEELANRTLNAVGLGPAAVAEVEDRATGEMHAVRLAGSLGDIFDALPAAKGMKQSQTGNADSEQGEQQ